LAWWSDASIAASARNRVTSWASLAEVRAQHLDRDLAPEPEILAAVDHAHRAARQLVEDPVGAAQRRPGVTPAAISTSAPTSVSPRPGRARATVPAEAPRTAARSRANPASPERSPAPSG
jgi:hypothetical protein